MKTNLLLSLMFSIGMLSTTHSISAAGVEEVDSLSASATLVHETLAYRATFHGADSPLKLEFRNSGKPLVWGPDSLSIVFHEVRGQIFTPIHFDQLVHPLKLEGHTLLWKGRMKNGVIITIPFELTAEGFAFSYSLERPVATSLPDLALRLVLNFPPFARQESEGSTNYLLPGSGNGIDLDEIPRAVRDLRLEYKTYSRGGKGRYRLNDDYRGFLGKVNEATVHAPDITSRFRFEGPKKDGEGYIDYWKYDGDSAVHKGFGIRFITEDKDKAPGPRFEVRVR